MLGFSGSIWPKVLVGCAVSILVVLAVLGYLYKKRRQELNAHYAMDSINYNNISREPIFSEVTEQKF